MTTPILIQARMGSTRFPGKVMHEIAGMPMIEHVLRNCRSVQKEVFVLMPQKDKDSILDNHVINGCFIDCDENNIVERFKIFLSNYDCGFFCRICSDSPLIHPSIIRTIINLQVKTKYNISCTLPPGQQVELFHRQTFLDTEFTGDAIEHPGKAFGWRPSSSKVPAMTVDTPEDADYIERFMLRLDSHPSEMSYPDLMREWVKYTKEFPR